MAARRIDVRITADGLTATVTVVPGAPAGREELAEALRAAGVVAGTEEAVCAGIAARLADPELAIFGEPIAQGRPSVPTRHATFDAVFHPGIQPAASRDDGTLDFHDRELLKPVEKNDLLAFLRAAAPGVPGLTVLGETIPVEPARALRLALGPGVVLRPDGAIHATRAGVILFTPGTSLDVVDHHVHAADVDLRSGHLFMEGSLVVKGSVARAFGVRASGDVEIQGEVDCGSVYAGGSVRIREGIRGGDDGNVCAEGDLSARHAEGAVVTCGGQLSLEESAGSELTAARIHVRRRLRGGTAIAEHAIVAGEAGSPHGVTDTTLIAGESIERSVLVAQRALEAAKSRRIAERLASSSVRDGAARSKGGKLGRTVAALDRSETHARVARAERRAELVASASVHVSGTAHAGVLVRIGDDRLVLDESISGVKFSMDPETRRIRVERTIRG